MCQQFVYGLLKLGQHALALCQYFNGLGGLRNAAKSITPDVPLS